MWFARPNAYRSFASIRDQKIPGTIDSLLFLFLLFSYFLLLPSNPESVPPEHDHWNGLNRVERTEAGNFLRPLGGRDLLGSLIFQRSEEMIEYLPAYGMALLESVDACLTEVYSAPNT